MRKSIIIIFIIGSFVLGLQSFHANQQPKYTNLQVLPKDITAVALDSIMDHFSSALNVKCGYCHERVEATRKMDFASDNKVEKLIARGMMKMSIDINKNHFAVHDASARNADGSLRDTISAGYLLRYVTCYTCHHGNARPVNHPPAAGEHAR